MRAFQRMDVGIVVHLCWWVDAAAHPPLQPIAPIASRIPARMQETLALCVSVWNWVVGFGVHCQGQSVCAADPGGQGAEECRCVQILLRGRMTDFISRSAASGNTAYSWQISMFNRFQDISTVDAISLENACFALFCQMRLDDHDEHWNEPSVVQGQHRVFGKFAWHSKYTQAQAIPGVPSRQSHITC